MLAPRARWVGSSSGRTSCKTGMSQRGTLRDLSEKLATHLRSCTVLPISDAGPASHKPPQVSSPSPCPSPHVLGRPAPHSPSINFLCGPLAALGPVPGL